MQTILARAGLGVGPPEFGTREEFEMRFIPTRIHGMMDYAMGLLLIAAPWLFRFNRGGAETWVPVILGIGASATAC